MRSPDLPPHRIIRTDRRQQYYISMEYKNHKSLVLNILYLSWEQIHEPQPGSPCRLAPAKAKGPELKMTKRLCRDDQGHFVPLPERQRLQFIRALLLAPPPLYLELQSYLEQLVFVCFSQASPQTISGPSATCEPGPVKLRHRACTVPCDSLLAAIWEVLAA